MSLAPSTQEENYRVRQLDAELAAVMWFGALLFLLLFATLVHLSIAEFQSPLITFCGWSMMVIYWIFPLEIFLAWRAGGRLSMQHFLVLLIPPLRLATRDHGDQGELWFPGLGWNPVNKDFERRLVSFFSIPMMAFALLVLPLILTEFFFSDVIRRSTSLTVSFHLAMAAIWSAFVVEFVVQMSVTSNRKKYLIRHWIDAVVILLPVVAFLRGLRLLQLVRIQQISRFVRLYRVRGVVLRTWRAIVALDLLERMLYRDPGARLARLHDRLADHETECESIRQKISRLTTPIIVDESVSVDSNVAGEVASSESMQYAETIAIGESGVHRRVDDGDRNIAPRKSRFGPAILDKGCLDVGFFSAANPRDHG